MRVAKAVSILRKNINKRGDALKAARIRKSKSVNHPFAIRSTLRAFPKRQIGKVPSNSTRLPLPKIEKERVAKTKELLEPLCFLPGTLIHTAEGLRVIESLKAGDLVWAKDEHTGEIALKTITQTFERVAPSTVALTFSNGEIVRATDEHPFYVQDRGFTPAGLVALGNSIVTRAGPSLQVTAVEKHSSAHKVYNFEVAEFHTYFVGKAALWVHNQCRIDLDENFLKHVMGDGGGIVSAAKRRANGSVEGGVKGTHNYKRFKDNYSNKVNIKSDTEFAPGFREVTYDGTPLYDSSGNLLPGKGNILLKKTTFDPDKITPNQYIDMVSQAVNEGFQAGRKRINPDGSTASRVFRGYSASPLGGAPIQFEFVINPKTKEIITAYPMP